MVQNLDGRFCLDNKISDDHPNGHKHPFVCRPCQLPAQHGPHRCKALVDTAQKQYKSHVCITKSHTHSLDLPFLIPSGQQLKNNKYHQNGANSDCHLPGVFGDFHSKSVGHILHCHNPCHLCRCIQCLFRRIAAAQHHHRHDRPHTGKCHQTKAVTGGIPVPAHRRQANAQCHNKRYRDGTGGHTAGVKSYRQKISGHKKRKQNQDRIKKDQHQRQIDM